MSTSETTTSMYQQAHVAAIIEPDVITRDSLALLLESVGLNVAIYSSAEHFLAKATKQKYSCLISEIELPGIDGLTLIKTLNQLNIQVPTIILTQKNDVSLAVRTIQAGAVDFIEKPFVEPILIDRVMQILAEDSVTGDSR